MLPRGMAILTIPAQAELEALVSTYALGSIEEATGIDAGTVNTSFRLTTATAAGRARTFLRLYEQQGLDGAQAEAALLVHLAARGVPTPAPLETPDGVRVRVVAGKPAALFPWVEGDMLCQRAVSTDAVREVGRALARVHRAGVPEGSPLGEGRFGPRELALRCDDIRRSTDPEARPLADDLRLAVLAAGRARSPDLPRGLVHGDLFRDNVLWHEGRIAALLDFESAHLGPFVFDLAVTMLSWCFDDDLRIDLARALAAGYQEQRELSAAERQALYCEARFATLRFTITRIADDAARVGKRWQRFVLRRESIERWGAKLAGAVFA